MDYARGEANLYSDSSSDESTSEEEEEGGTFDKWGELDADAEQTEEPTQRLAVCNMDWDRVGPEDIFLVGHFPSGNKTSCYVALEFAFLKLPSMVSQIGIRQNGEKALPNACKID